MGTGGCPADHQSASPSEAAQRISPATFAHAVHHHIRSVPTAEPAKLCHHIGASMVDRSFGTQTSCRLQLGVRATRNNCSASEQTRNLKCGECHTAANPP